MCNTTTAVSLWTIHYGAIDANGLVNQSVITAMLSDEAANDIAVELHQTTGIAVNATDCYGNQYETDDNGLFRLPDTESEHYEHTVEMYF